MISLKQVILFIVVSIFGHQSLKAQIFSELLKRLPPNATFKQQQQLFNRHFDSIPKRTANTVNEVDEKEGNEGEYKRWKRFEWLAERRLDENGMLRDATEFNQKAAEERQRTTVPMSPEAAAGFSNGWTALGPTGTYDPNNSNGGINNNMGRVNCIAFHPTDPNTWYIGTATGGVWKTTNNGESYKPISDTLPSLGISSIVVHPTNPETVFILTGDGNTNISIYYGRQCGTGVYKSTNGGTTWAQTGLIWTYASNTFGFKLVMQPGNPNTMLAATSSGIWRTTDAGVTWANVQNALTFTDIEFKPDNSSVIFATGRNTFRVYYSTTSGATWNFMTTPYGIAADRMELAVSAASPNRIYALAGPAGTGNFNGLTMYDGTNYATPSWQVLANTPNLLGYATTDNYSQTWCNISLYVAPYNANTVLTGGTYIYKIDFSNGDFNRSFNLHPDNLFIVKHPLNGHLYTGCDGGIFTSTDTGTTWKSLSKGLQITQFYDFDASANNFGNILGASQDNGHVRRNLSSSSYRWWGTGDGMQAVIDYTDDTKQYGCNQNGGFFRGRNADQMQFSSTQPTPVNDYWVTNLALHNTVPTTLFFGGNGGIRRSVDTGNTWTDIGASGQHAMAQGTSNPDRFYAAQNLVLRRSDNVNAASPSWTNISGSSPNYPTNTASFITSIAVNPDDSPEVWIGLSGFVLNQKVYRSLDAGVTWTNQSAGLPNLPIHCLVYEDNNGSPGGALYAGTDNGVYYRDNIFGIWIPCGQYLPNSPVTGLKIVNIGGTKYLYASTHGRGMWYTMSYSQNGCSPYLQLSNSAYGIKTYGARDSLYTTATTTGFTGTDISLKGGTYIRFGPGAVYSGSNGKMDAAIAVCTGGGIPNPNTSAEMLGVDDAEVFFAQSPVVSSKAAASPNLIKQKEGGYIATFTSDGKHEITLTIKDVNGENLGYFVKTVLGEGVYELPIPKVKPKKDLWLAIEQNGVVTRLKL